jgi:DNA repair photolyase
MEYALGKMRFESTPSHPSDRVIYGVSTGTLNDKLAAAFEQGTPMVSKRIKSLHWLQDNGFRTFGMICPSLPQLNAEGYENFAADMAEAIRVDRCEHVWAEVVNVRGESFIRTEKALLDAGFGLAGALLKTVSHDKQEWETYARRTFLAHTHFIPPEKLRFLQYVTNDTRDGWQERAKLGAILL